MKYTIIIPTHNRPDELVSTLKTVRPLKDAEIIVIENNSTNENVEEYKKIDLKDNEKIFYTNENGLSAARNYGLNIAKGEYIFFLDDDDKLTEEFPLFLNKFKPKFDVYRFPQIFDHGRILKPFLPMFMRNIDFHWSAQVSTFLIRRDYINDRLGYRFMVGVTPEDTQFAAMMMNSVRGFNKMRFINTLSIIRASGRDDSLSTSNQAADLFHALDKYVETLDGKNSFLNSVAYSYMYWLVKHHKLEADEIKKIVEYDSSIGKTSFNNSFRVRKVKKFLKAKKI